MAAEWKKFTNTDKQRKAILGAKHGVVLQDLEGTKDIFSAVDRYTLANITSVLDYYLICEPLAHAKMRCEHAMTGQVVEYLENSTLETWAVASTPAWSPTTKYRFKQPEKKTLYYRNYLLAVNTNVVGVCWAETNAAKEKIAGTIEHDRGFRHWLDDWQELKEQR